MAGIGRRVLLGLLPMLLATITQCGLFRGGEKTLAPEAAPAVEGEPAAATDTSAVAQAPEQAQEGPFQMAQTYHAQGDLDKAIEVYQEALKSMPERTDIRYQLGNAYLDKGDLKNAAKTYEAVLATKPDYAAASYNLGTVLYRQQKYSKASTVYQQALLRFPEAPELYNNLGNAYLQQDALDQAIEAYNKALAVDSTYALAYYNLSIAYARQGAVAEVVRNLQSYLEHMPQASDRDQVSQWISTLGESGGTTETPAETLPVEPQSAPNPDQSGEPQ